MSCRARRGAIWGLIGQQSAEAIVAAAAARQGGEGPNMNRQGGAVTDSTSTMNPTGGARGRRWATQPALQVALMEQVVAPANMQRAWRQVKSNQGAPGIEIGRAHV